VGARPAAVPTVGPTHPTPPHPTPPHPQLYDTWFFWAHRYAHINKWMFRHIHAKHHRNDAYLDVTSNSFEHPLDGLLVVGIPVGFVAWFGLWSGNWWFFFVPMHTIASIFVFGARRRRGGLGGGLWGQPRRRQAACSRRVPQRPIRAGGRLNAPPLFSS
jgi:hypothetical protein